jgi:hypothetical protein
MDRFRTSGHHAYLFERAGPLVSPRPWIVPRALLLAICSGSALAFGLALVLRLIPIRAASVAGLFGAIALAALVPPNALSLIAQSAALGILLALFSAIIHWVVQRRVFRAAPPDRSANRSTPERFAQDPVQEAGVVRADASTVLRQRGSTDSRPKSSQPSAPSLESIPTAGSGRT